MKVCGEELEELPAYNLKQHSLVDPPRSLRTVILPLSESAHTAFARSRPLQERNRCIQSLGALGRSVVESCWRVTGCRGNAEARELARSVVLTLSESGTSSSSRLSDGARKGTLRREREREREKLRREPLSFHLSFFFFSSSPQKSL